MGMAKNLTEKHVFVPQKEGSTWCAKCSESYSNYNLHKLPSETTKEEQEWEIKSHHSYTVGIAVGLEEAGNLVMKKAVESFAAKKDELAKFLRDLATDLMQRGKDRHPGRPPRV